jgi:hypothetical protein
MTNAGSIRNVEQSKELMGDFKGYSTSGSGNKRTLNYTQNGTAKSFNMNKSVNYDKNDLPQEVKDFMKMQGDDVKYVA